MANLILFKMLCSSYTLTKYNQDKLARISATMLINGNVGIIPTDTIYGFSADYFNKDARDYIIKLKNRDASKSFIVLLPDIKSLKHFAKQDIPQQIINLLPAPITFIVKNRYSELYSENTIAIRIPQYSFLTSILFYTKRAIISTSFNYKNSSIEDAVREDYKNKINFFVLDKDKKQDGKASTIVDISKKPYNIVRQGEYELPASILF